MSIINKSKGHQIQEIFSCVISKFLLIHTLCFSAHSHLFLFLNKSWKLSPDEACLAEMHCGSNCFQFHRLVIQCYHNLTPQSLSDLQRQNLFTLSHNIHYTFPYVRACPIFYLNYIPIHKMEDDSLLDDPTILVCETPPQTSVTPGSFSMKLVSRLGLNRIKRPETVSNNNKSTTPYIAH